MFKKTILVVAVCVTFSMLETGQAEAGNGSSSWRWSKPLNQRQGLLYTTNKAHKKTSTQPRTRRYFRGGTTRWFTPSSPSRSSSNSDTFFRPGRSGIIPFDGVGQPYPFFR